jgi:putative SOS response-associated peptidase YedK
LTHPPSEPNPQLKLLALLRPYPAEQMQASEAHKDVGNVRNNHPDLLNSA